MNSKDSELLPIPDKVYFTIGEVSNLCDVKAHVIRYWETEFKMLSPVRRRNRRYYQRKDIELIRKIACLLYQEGYTIDGARQQLQRKTKESDTPKKAVKDAKKEPVQVASIANLVMDLKRVLADLDG